MIILGNTEGGDGGERAIRWEPGRQDEGGGDFLKIDKLKFLKLKIEN